MGICTHIAVVVWNKNTRSHYSTITLCTVLWCGAVCVCQILLSFFFQLDDETFIVCLYFTHFFFAIIQFINLRVEIRFFYELDGETKTGFFTILAQSLTLSTLEMIVIFMNNIFSCTLEICHLCDTLPPSHTCLYDSQSKCMKKIWKMLTNLISSHFSILNFFLCMCYLSVCCLCVILYDIYIKFKSFVLSWVSLHLFIFVCVSNRWLK